MRGLVDDNYRPLLDITSDGMMLFGRPVRLSPSLDDIGVSKYPVVFGDLSYFVRQALRSRGIRVGVSAIGKLGGERLGSCAVLCAVRLEPDLPW